MKLVFLYTCINSAGEGSGRPWDPTVKTINQYASLESGFPTEGYFFLIKRMVEEGIVDEAVVAIECARHTGSTYYRTKKGRINCYVMPEINYIRPYIQKGDIIWVRGGFRSWFNFLTTYKGKNWLMLYAANTGRERWTFWDIILEDLHSKSLLDSRGRFWLPFIKPMQEEIIFPKDLPMKYDICIGSSNVHDKKAQWKVIEVICEYKKIFGVNLRCVLPGKIKNGVHTNLIRDRIKEYNLDVTITNRLSRKEMCDIYNQSRLFVYLGQGGQNDRGPLESLRCGTPIILASYNRHAFFFNQNNKVVKVVDNPEDFKDIAIGIQHCLNEGGNPTRKETIQFFEATSSMEKVILPRMKKLFDILRENKPDTKMLNKKMEENSLLKQTE